MPTLTQYRQQAAKELGRYAEGTAVTTSSTTTLVDTNWPIKSTLNQDDLYSDYFLYRPNAVVEADKVRIVATYTPASGFLVADRPWDIAPYGGGVGEAYELHGIIEPHTDLKEMLNEALKRCYIMVEVTLTPITDQIRHSLSTVAPWFTDPLWLINTGVMQLSDDRDEVDPYSATIRGEVVQDGATYYFVHRGRSFNPSTELVYLQMLKPAYYHCRPSGGTYGAQSGLSLESDECPVAVNWVAAGTLVEAWRHYSQLLEPSANQKLMRNREEASAWFTRLSNENVRIPTPRIRKPLLMWGPRY